MGEAMSGLLADLYSTIDSKKRQLAGLLADPVETLKLGLLNFKNDQNALLDTQSTAYPWTGAYQQKPTPQQQAAAQKQLADHGANMGIAAATVWHGSPHKFDTFDSSKIGTGEGAQAYGHGLYLAENPGVARQYSQVLSDAAKLTPEGRAARALSENGDDLIAAKQAIYREYNAATSPAMQNAAMKAIDVLQSGKAKAPQLYKVDLPDEAIAKMLDYDRPLSEQAPAVQELLNRAGLYDGPARNVSGNVLDDITAYISKQNGRVTTKLTKDRAAAAEALLNAGIPGIRYLDGGSRGAGSGTSNYVIFPGNEDLLTILERNGQGLLGK